MSVLAKLYKIDYEVGLVDVLDKTDKYIEALQYPKTIELPVRGKTLDYIAYKLYGDYNLWVVLYDYNNIEDPLDLPDTLYVIPKSEIAKVLQ